MKTRLLSFMLVIAILAFVLTFGLSGLPTARAQARPGTDDTATPYLSPEGPHAEASPAFGSIQSSATAVGTPLFQLDLSTPTGDSLLLGVEFDGTYYWTTGGNSQAEPNKLYKLDLSGALVSTYDQPAGCSGFGGRDMAFDGTYLYFGCDDGYIHQVDPATGAQVETIHAPITPPRALAYDPATDHFWTASWSSAIFELDRSGTVVDFCPSVGQSTGGMAWDAESPGGPYLWLWAPNMPPPGNSASQFDPGSCWMTGVHFRGVDLDPGGTNNTAGGATVSDDVVPGRLVLLAMHLAEPDTLIGYNLLVRAYLPLVLRNP
jgi:hypothetical protein